jgi:pyruvate/2-oxoglutarate dehydrogenase complex dihydrolipoamide acyltransferase (E2) component
MAVPLYTPRVNNNDDSVRVSHLFIERGAFVRRGDPVADVETDKATFTVEAEQDGYVLDFNARPGDTVDVGSILAWMGSDAAELAPQEVETRAEAMVDRNTVPTLKAALLLARYGLEGNDVAAEGERLSVADVERHIRLHGLNRRSAPEPAVTDENRLPSASGKTVKLNPEERGMLRTVAWHKQEAVPAYLELTHDPEPWESYAAEFQRDHRLLLNPLLPLLAYRLVRIARQSPLINATMLNYERYEYDHVNLGFTVQAGMNLYVVVVREAENLTESELASRLGELQRSAMKNALRPEEASGATIALSSMARWQIARHVPILVPHTALMVAHAAPVNGVATLGATYDHRVLHGAAVAQVLRELACPEARQEKDT